MAKVVPAILSSNLQDYQQKIRLVRQLTDRYQLDVIDPEYVDNATLGLRDIEPRRDMNCDIHLMSHRPMDFLQAIIAFRPHLAILQYEDAADIEEALRLLREKGISVGIALNPSTQVEDVAPELVHSLDHVLVMAYPAGFSGQALQPRVLKKAQQLRELESKLEIGLDGGVGLETLPKIAKAGFDVVNTNSYLFDCEDVLSRYSELMEVLG